MNLKISIACVVLIVMAACSSAYVLEYEADARISPIESPIPSALPIIRPAEYETFTYQCGILGVKFCMEIPAEWQNIHTFNASPGYLLFNHWWPYINHSAWSIFNIAEGTIHPSKWGEIFHQIDFDAPMYFWQQPEAPTEVFISDAGLTVVMYVSESIRWQDQEFSTILFMFRKDGQDYRSINGAQIFYYAILDVPTALLDDYYETTRAIVNSIRFYEGAEVSLEASAIAQSIGITAANYPRIDGSTSTLPIVSELIRTMFYSGDPNYPEWWPYRAFRASRTIPSYQLLIANYVDMILVPNPSTEILIMAEDAGVELEFIPIGVEALVFITHEDNPVSNIALEQVLEIYAEMNITNWEQIGGYDGRIIPLNRNPHSGSQTQMDNLVLEGRQVHPTLEENYQLSGMLDMLSSVRGPWWAEGDHDFALGYTVYFYLKQVQGQHNWFDDIKPLSLDGVFPSHETILSGDYPIATNYFAVIRADTPENSPARILAEWLQTPSGQKVIHSAGIGTLN